MRFKSFLHYFTNGWKKRTPVRRKGSEQKHSTRPLVELLESRELLANDIPTILAAGTFPADGSSTSSGTPVIQVQFSESMTSSALTANNYVLLGSSGNIVPINTASFVSFGAAPPNSVVQLTYNGGAQLVVDTYTLFVRGQNLSDQDDNLPMAQPGQLLVGNAGRNNVAVVNLPGDGTLGALSNYNLPGVAAATARPNAVAFQDLDNDGIKDLVVVKAGTDELAIYLGKAAADGGGFSTTPDLTLPLPTSTTVNLAHSIAFGDFNNDNKKDIVVANYNTSNITTFLNTTTTAGTVTFGAGANTTVDASPVGLVVADFDDDTNADVIVLADAASSDISTPADGTNDFRIDVLPGTGAGGFGTLARIRIGDATTGISGPTSIAFGKINNDNFNDLVIGSTIGAFYLKNTSTGAANFGFQVSPPAMTTSSIRAIAVAKMDSDNNPDIVVTTAANTVEVINNGGGPIPVFSTPVSIAVAAGTAGGLAVGDLDNNGRADIVVANGLAAGQVTVLRNDSVLTGSITSASEVGGVNPISITTATAHGLVTGDQVTIAGVSGFAAANGAFTITVVDSTHFTLNGTTTAGSGTGGTWTSAGVSVASLGTFNTDATPLSVALADTNQDGVLDVVTANNTANDVSLMLGLGDGTFQSSTNIAVTPTVTHGIAIGDVNRDGITDIVTVNFNSGFGGAATVSVLLGKSGGTYNAPVNYQFPGGFGAVANVVDITLGDVNGDARPDILVVDSGNNKIGIMLNNITVQGGPLTGTSFQATNSAGTDQTPNSIAVGDVNKDGKLDLIVGHNRSGGGGGGGGGPPRQGVDVILGNGDGTFQNPVNFLNNLSIASVAVGNFSGDNNLDIVAADNSNNTTTVQYLTGDGAGGFTAQGSAAAGLANNLTRIRGADVNGDGFLDVIVSSSSTNTTSAGIAVLLNQLGSGFGTFKQADVIPGTGIQDVIANDVNQDGLTDLIASTQLNLQSGTIPNGQGGGGSGVVSITPSFVVRLNGANGLNVNDQIQLANMTGLTGANLVWTISNISGGGGGGGRQYTLIGNPLPTGTYTSGGTWSVFSPGVTTNDNVFVLIGNGDGSFKTPVPYLAGGTGLPNVASSWLAATTSPLLRVTTFTSGGTVVSTNLINNGNFESRDLNGEQGNLLGWSTYNLPASPGGSHGAYAPQTGNLSPLSGTSVATATGKYSAMLDEPNILPIPTSGGGGGGGGGGPPTNPNAPSTYEGTHLLYQDVTIPANISAAQLTLRLYINNTDTTDTPAYSDPADPTATSLDYRTSAANQQVRVDIMGTHAITNASNPTSGPIVISSPAHGLSSGAQVQILGVQGNVGANGIFTITVIDANRFSLNSSLPTGAYTSGGYWTRLLNVNPTKAITDASNPPSGPIVISSAAHGLLTGAQIQVFGVQGNTAANGVFTVTVIDADHFSLNGSTGNGAYTNGGAFSAFNAATGFGDVLRNEFITAPTSTATITTTINDNDLTAFAGQTIRLRIASANNRGRLIIGVDNVRLNVQVSDSTAPTLSNFGIRNPSFMAGTVAHTADPTVTGYVADNSGVDGINFIEFDLNNNGFTNGSDDVKTTQFDATGHFSYTIANPKLGLNTIGVKVVDKAGNAVNSTFSFFVQSNSVTEWQPIGPQGIDVTNQRVDYTKVSGRITTIVADKNDPTGNTYFVGSANGGIWKTTDGGFDWTPLTNSVNVNGVAQFVPIGSIAQSRSNPSILYAATGVGDQQLGSQDGVGVLKSTDGGLTWNLIGDSATSMAGARAVKMVIDNDNPDVAYVGVATDSTGTTGGVYKTIDGGLTWTNVLLPQNMFLAAGGTVGAGAKLPSVTDLIIDPFNANRLLVGLGNIGLVGARTTAGLWRTTTKGGAWDQIVGGDGIGLPAPNAIPNSTLPSGATVGRVTISMGNGRVGDERFVYVMMTSVPGNNTPPNVDWGQFNAAPGGLYRSSDNLLNFTKVMMKQNFNPGAGLHNFVNINLMAHDAANAGALAVDPTNPYVVYVGGSNFWSKAGDGPNQNFIRVDTGNMRDTTYHDFTGAIPNDGDDIDKAFEGLAPVAQGGRAGFYDNTGPSPTTTDPYVGEGVYWYNLTGNASGTNGKLTSLPSQIESLAFDSQGRLLVGTSGGIWRGVNYGFKYDNSSGNTGIKRVGGGGGFGGGSTPFSTLGMTFTAINGNLQISDMTSVAVDPNNRGVYYTTQFGTGVAGSTQSLVWVSQGLTGPVVNGQNLNIPNAASVLVANPPAGSPADTPVTLFRIWQYANSLALSPETSSDNGTTWSSLAAAGINQAGNIAGFFPGFAVSPSTFDLSGIPQNQLLFGTNKVYITSTSGSVWDPLPTAGAPISGAGGLITAMSFSPSDANVYYVGTDLGEVFIFSASSDPNGPPATGGWSQRGVGVLPTTQVEAIQVDPNDAKKVYALFGGNTGALGHVWFSNDAGTTWTDISGTPGGANSLPAAPAYAMVIDRTPNLGAPNGKIYVATQVGVFYSINDGASWKRLGLGMPNVPVVDLKFSPNLQVLAAATLGRGVYTINTSTLSFIPDQVIDEDQTAGPIPFSVNDPGGSTYTLAAVSDNQALVPNGNIILGGSGNNRTITFTPALHANSPANGVAHITITLTSGGFVSTQTFQVTVNFVNYAPTISNLPTQTTLKDQPLTINFSVGDVETPAGSLIVTAGSSDNSIVPNLPANLTLAGAGAARTLTITPAPGVTGSTVISITATDPLGAFTTKSFDLLVTQLVTLPFADNFNRANSIFLGPGWNVNAGTMNTKNSQAQAGNGLSIGSLNQLSAADITLQADVGVAAGQDMGFLARYSGTGTKNYYMAHIVSVGTGFKAEIEKNVNGVFTVLSSQPVATGVGTLRFDVVGTSLKLFYDDDLGGPHTMKLVAHANDASFSAAGTAGLISLLGNATADNFSATAITLLTPTLPFNDSFTQLDDSQLSRNWLEQAGNFSVSSNRLIAKDAGTKQNVAIVNGVQVNTSVQADVTVLSSQEAGVITRYNAAGYYYAQIFNNGVKTTAAIYKVNSAGTKTLLSTIATLTNNIGTVRLEAAGPSLRLYYTPNGGSASLVAYGYDSSYASGNNGIRASQSATLDNFNADVINLLTPSLSFSETFPQADGPLSRNWNDKAGNFNVVSNVLVGSGSAIGMATINGALTDGAIQADIVLGNTVNQQVGLIARFNTTGTTTIFNNYYYAQIVRTSTGAFAKIFKVSENTITHAVTMTQLGASAAVAPGAATIRFEAAGPSLKLFYGPDSSTMTLATYAFDSGFASGTFGVRATTDGSLPTVNATQIKNVNLSAIVLTTPPTYPFTDTFTQVPPDTALSRNWTERQGNFSVNASGILVANGTRNLATVNGLLDNSSIQADILVGANQEAGLITRFKASNGQYYYAQLLNVTTTNATTHVTTSKTTLTLYKFTGSFVKLAGPFTVDTATATAPATITYNPATLRFEVAGTNLKAFYGPVGGPLNLVAFAYDSSLPPTGVPAAGVDGILSTKNATFDNVIVDQINLLTPPLPFSDDFSVDGQLSRNWDERAGNYGVSSGTLVANAANNLATVHGIAIGDGFVQADVTVGTGQIGGVVARYTPAASGVPESYYYAYIKSVSGGFRAEIQKIAKGVVTTLASVPVLSGTGTINFQVEGSNLKLFYGTGTLTLVTYAYDSTLTTGTTGIRATKNVVIDNFNTDAIALVTPSLPFTDSFALPDNSQLSTSWLERAGNMQIVGGALTAFNASSNIATINGVLPDSAMQADVDVDNTAGQAAGVVARYSTSGYYLARISFNGTVYQATLYRFSGGMLTALTTPVTVGSGNGTLRLEVAGPSLKLFYGPVGAPVFVVNAYDSKLTTGTSGVLLTKGSSTIEQVTLSAITFTTPTAPFTDTFTLADGAPISRDWTERGGLFQISSSALSFVNAAATNFATVNLSAGLADAAVQADIVVGAAVGKNAALVARYSSAGYYQAVIQNAGVNLFVAQIYKVVNGLKTRIDAVGPAFTYSTGTPGTIRFEVAGTSLKLFFGPVGGPLTLRSFANDTKLIGPGTVGVSTVGSIVDNFSVAAITLQNPSLPFVDPFTQADGSELSLNWLNRAGNYQASANAIVGSAGSNLATVNGVNINNATVDLSISLAATQFAGVVARYSISAGGVASYYVGRIASVATSVSPTGFRAEIWRYVGTTATLLASAPASAGVGVLRFRVVGNNLKVFFGANAAVLNLVTFAYDSNLTIGSTGVTSSKNTPIDNFATDVIVLPSSQSLPYSETFVSNPPTHQLSNNWLDRSGNYTFDTVLNRLVGKGTSNSATLNGLSAADIDLQGAFTLATVGQSAGLIARYQSGANMYSASITFTGAGVYSVSIVKVVNGVATTIGSKTVAAFGGVFRFQTSGTTLRVFLDGSATPLMTVTDASISAAGFVGIKSSAGSQWASFSAS